MSFERDEGGSDPIANASKISRNVPLELWSRVLNMMASSLVAAFSVEPYGSPPNILAPSVLVAALNELAGGHDPHHLHSLGPKHESVVFPLPRVIDGGE